MQCICLSAVHLPPAWLLVVSKISCEIAWAPRAPCSKITSANTSLQPTPTSEGGDCAGVFLSLSLIQCGQQQLPCSPRFHAIAVHVNSPSLPSHASRPVLCNTLRNPSRYGNSKTHARDRPCSPAPKDATELSTRAESMLLPACLHTGETHTRS